MLLPWDFSLENNSPGCLTFRFECSLGICRSKKNGDVLFSHKKMFIFDHFSAE